MQLDAMLNSLFVCIPEGFVRFFMFYLLIKIKPHEESYSSNNHAGSSIFSIY